MLGFFEILRKTYCFVVAMSDLVHDVEITFYDL